MQIRTMPLGEIRKRVSANNPELANAIQAHNKSLSFVVSQSVGDYIRVDEQHQKVMFPHISMQNALNNMISKSAEKEYSYTDIVGFELIENDSSVTSGGLGSAAVRGALFGGAGAVTGAIIGKKTTTGLCKNLRVKVTVKDSSNPMIMIDFLNSPVKTNSPQYLKAQEDAHRVLSLLQIISGDSPQQTASMSSADEIKKFKELLDCGAITQEEFEEQKKKLLARG